LGRQNRKYTCLFRFSFSARFIGNDNEKNIILKYLAQLQLEKINFMKPFESGNENQKRADIPYKKI